MVDKCLATDVSVAKRLLTITRSLSRVEYRGHGNVIE